MQTEEWFRFVVLGDSGVGKSSICHRFLTGEILGPERALLEEDSHVKTFWCHGTLCRVEFHDSKGGLEYSVVTDQKRVSFDAVVKYHEMCLRSKDNNQIPCVLVANKSDLELLAEVPKDEGKELAEYLSCPFIECSAITGTTVNRIFDECIKQIVQQNEITYCHTFPELLSSKGSPGKIRCCIS